MEENVTNFEQKMEKLVALAKSKKNMLEASEVEAIFKDMPMQAEQMEQIYDYLEAKKIDVLRVNDDISDDAIIIEMEEEEEIERNNYIEAVARAYRVGYEELKKLVVKMAVQSGMATPATKAKNPSEREGKKEDGNIKSQKILLTWLIDHEELFPQIRKYITPEDFTTDLYKKVAELLFEQYENGSVNPAKIMNFFTEEEEHREAASLFHTRIKELTTKQEQEKAIKETVIRVKNYSVEVATKQLAPTDIQGLQRLMNAKKELQDLQRLHISIN